MGVIYSCMTSENGHKSDQMDMKVFAAYSLQGPVAQVNVNSTCT